MDTKRAVFFLESAFVVNSTNPMVLCERSFVAVAHTHTPPDPFPPPPFLFSLFSLQHPLNMCMHMHMLCVCVCMLHMLNRRNRTMSGHDARHMTPTAAASVGARRRRPSPPTDGSHGRAVSKNLGRCAPAGCSATSGRSPETPGSLPSTPGPEGERQWSAASATLRSAPRPHRLRRASMARRSTAACPVCSWHSVQPRQAL